MSQIESPSQAVNVLLQGVQVAQKRGAYSLEEASVLSSAVSYLSTPTAEATDEATAEEVSDEDEGKQI
jgi:hypothetical protein